MCGSPDIPAPPPAPIAKAAPKAPSGNLNRSGPGRSAKRRGGTRQQSTLLTGGGISDDQLNLGGKSLLGG